MCAWIESINHCLRFPHPWSAPQTLGEYKSTTHTILYLHSMIEEEQSLTTLTSSSPWIKHSKLKKWPEMKLLQNRDEDPGDPGDYANIVILREKNQQLQRKLKATNPRHVVNLFCSLSMPRKHSFQALTTNLIVVIILVIILISCYLWRRTLISKEDASTECSENIVHEVSD